MNFGEKCNATFAKDRSTFMSYLKVTNPKPWAKMKNNVTYPVSNHPWAVQLLAIIVLGGQILKSGLFDISLACLCHAHEKFQCFTKHVTENSKKDYKFGHDYTLRLFTHIVHHINDTVQISNLQLIRDRFWLVQVTLMYLKLLATTLRWNFGIFFSPLWCTSNTKYTVQVSSF